MKYSLVVMVLGILSGGKAEMEKPIEPDEMDILRSFVYMLDDCPKRLEVFNDVNENRVYIRVGGVNGSVSGEYVHFTKSVVLVTDGLCSVMEKDGMGYLLELMKFWNGQPYYHIEVLQDLADVGL